MGKRAAEKQLTKDDADAGVDHDAGASVGTDGSFKKAPLEVLKKRRILKVRRTAPQPTPEKTAPASNPFATVPAPSKAPASASVAPYNPFAKLSAPSTETNTDAKPDTPAKEPASEDEPPAPAAAAGSPKANVDEAPAAPTEAETAKENGVEKKASSEEKADNKEVKKKEDEKSAVVEKESKDEEKPSTDTPTTTTAPEKPTTDKPQHGDAKEEPSAPAENTSAAKDSAAAPAEPEKKAAEPSPAVFKFSKPFVFGGTAATSVKTFADAANASKDPALNGASNGGGGTLAGGFTFSAAAAASLSEAMKNSNNNGATSFAGVGKPTTPGKGEFEETKVASGEEGETTVHKVRAKVFGLDAGAWRERGVGALKLNVEEKAKTARLLLRNEATLRLALNAPLYKDLKLDRAGERGVRLKDMASGTVFLVRVGTKDGAQKLVDAVEEETKKLP